MITTVRKANVSISITNRRTLTAEVEDGKVRKVEQVAIACFSLYDGFTDSLAILCNEGIDSLIAFLEEVRTAIENTEKGKL